MVSIFFFGCASTPEKEYQEKPSEKVVKKGVQLQDRKTPSDVTLTVMTFNIKETISPFFPCEF